MRNLFLTLFFALFFIFSSSTNPVWAQSHGDHGGNHGGGGNNDEPPDSSEPGEPGSGSGGDSGSGGGHGGHSSGQLQQGRYLGYLKIEGRKEKLALQADFFQESPEDFTQFPKLEAILKVSLGGYHTTEYMTSVFENIRYNFETGDLTFDEPSNDLVLTAKVHNMGGRTHLQGEVWSRTSSISGTFSLTSESDEPGAETSLPDENDQIAFSPLLDGQYAGKCNDKDAIFQIQTMKGLRSRDSADGEELFDYEIVARVGYRTDANSPNKNVPWEAFGNFAGGSYDPFRGKLVFLGPSTTAIECLRSGKGLSCSYRVQKGKIRCDFVREAANPRPASVAARKFALAVTPEQMQNIPEPGTISDQEMANLLAGHYTGYLHHETLDRYQRVALHVVSSVSTENPHNPNKVFVSTTSVMYFGAKGEDQFVSQRYEPRSFYIRPGFTLNAPGTDSFIQIEQWKKGYIRGVWYSQEFGKVGVVEFVKGQAQPLSSKAVITPNIRGEFKGSTGSGDTLTSRWFNVILPNQPAERLSSTITFVGAFQAVEALTHIEPIERGVYDPYTGALGFSFAQNDGLSIVSGKVAGDGNLQMYWPPAPNAMAVALFDYRPSSFGKVDGLYWKRYLNLKGSPKK